MSYHTSSSSFWGRRKEMASWRSLKKICRRLCRGCRAHVGKIIRFLCFNYIDFINPRATKAVLSPCNPCLPWGLKFRNLVKHETYRNNDNYIVFTIMPCTVIEWIIILFNVNSGKTKTKVLAWFLKKKIGNL